MVAAAWAVHFIIIFVRGITTFLLVPRICFYLQIHENSSEFCHGESGRLFWRKTCVPFCTVPTFKEVRQSIYIAERGCVILWERNKNSSQPNLPTNCDDIFVITHRIETTLVIWFVCDYLSHRLQSTWSSVCSFPIGRCKTLRSAVANQSAVLISPGLPETP